MDEAELRQAALELLVTEILALMPASYLQQLQANIEAESLTDDERTIRAQAIEWIDIGRRRFDEFSDGIVIRPNPHP